MAADKQTEEKTQSNGGKTQPEQKLNLQYDHTAHATYSNLCRITGTPEELIMDFALNPNSFGPILDEGLKIDHRIVMGYEAAKRTALVLLQTVRQHEERFGEIELDPHKRLRSFKAPVS